MRETCANYLVRFYVPYRRFEMDHSENRKNKIIRIIYTILTTALFVAVLLIILHPGLVDKVFCQELRYPNMTALMDQMDESYRTIPVALETAVKDYPWTQEKNILQSYELADWEVGGVDFQREEPSLALNGMMVEPITLSGTATEPIWPALTAERMHLDKGVYYVTSGVEETDVFCFLEGRNKDVSIWVSEGLGEDIFVVSDPYEFWDGYSLNLFIDQGHPAEKVTIHPRLVKILDYDPNMGLEQVLIWSGINRHAWDNLPREEQDIMIRTIRNRASDCAWASIVFDDGTGIRVDREETKKGAVKLLGIIDGE